MRFVGAVSQRARDRICLRVDPTGKARLRAAVDGNVKTVTGFLLAAGAEQVDAVLKRTAR